MIEEAEKSGRIKPGVSEEIVCTIDLAASCAALTEVALPADACLDSFNVLAALLGEDGAKGREHLVQQDNGRGGNFGFRVGDWKLQRHDSEKTKNAQMRLKQQRVPKFQLFNLAKDAAESNNVIDEYPEVAADMKRQLSQLIAAGRSRP